MSINMEQDMKLYFEKSQIWSHVDQCVAMMKSILNLLLCFKNGHMVLYSFFMPKKLNNASRSEQPYTEAPLGSQVTEKKLTFNGTSGLETLFTTAQHHRTLSRTR